MAYQINSECIACGICADVCPVDAVLGGDIVYSIIAEKCTECVGDFDNPRCAEECPTSACVKAG